MWNQVLDHSVEETIWRRAEEEAGLEAAQANEWISRDEPQVWETEVASGKQQEENNSARGIPNGN